MTTFSPNPHTPHEPGSFARLISILTYGRPFGSAAEDRLRESLPGRTDFHGNRVATVGNSPQILFSSHLDTVHRTDERLALSLDPHTLTLSTAGPYPLGADCGAGVWLMEYLYSLGVEGLYIWHTGEEVGGLGSRSLAHYTPEILHPIKVAIAFDRRGTRDIIIRQCGYRSASTAFARALAQALADAGAPGYAPAEGLYTDTAEYTHIISECTNISVGYDREHTPKETLNIPHLYRLRRALPRVNWPAVVAAHRRLPADNTHILEEDKSHV